MIQLVTTILNQDTVSCKIIIMKYINDSEDKIKNVIFDLGGVLLDIDVSLTVKKFDELNISGLKKEDIHPNQQDFFLDIETGHISNDEFIEKIRQTYPDARNTPEQDIWDAWNALLLDFDLSRFELIRKLSDTYNIYLLSNTNLPHRLYYIKRFYEQAGQSFESYFKKCYYSDEMLTRKPNRDIYEAVVADAAINPAETLFIDDNEPNFEGAKAVGIVCHHLKAPQTIHDIFK